MVRRPTSDASSVLHQISQVDTIRGKEPLSDDEKWYILQVFYGLHEELHSNLRPIATHGPLRDYRRTERLCGRGRATVKRIIAAWNKTLRVQSEERHTHVYKALKPSSK